MYGDLLFENGEGRIKAVINRLEYELKIKRGEPPSENNKKEIKKLEERIDNLTAQAEAIRMQNKRKTNPRTAPPKSEKSEPEPEYILNDDDDEFPEGLKYDFRDMPKPKIPQKLKPKRESKSRFPCCGSRPSRKLKKTHKKRKRKQKQTKKRKKKKQTRKYKKLR